MAFNTLIQGVQSVFISEFNSDIQIFKLNNSVIPFKDYFIIQEQLKAPKSVESLAKKWKVSEDRINQELDKGQKVEREHTTDNHVARTIASHHLFEMLDYYDKLAKMEKS